MTKENGVVIAGNGVAGLFLARELAEQTDVPTTVVAPGLHTSSPTVQTERRFSTPVISEMTSDTIGLDHSRTPGITAVQLGPIKVRGLRGKIRESIRRQSQKALSSNPLYIIDAERARLHLLRQIQELSGQEGSNIALVDGSASGLQMQGDRVTGVLIEGQAEPINASLVVDATGRPARLASSLDVQQITERKKSQPSAILGGYVNLSDPQLRTDFPQIEKDLIVGILPGKIHAFLAPTESLPNSTATHVLVIEGNIERIRDAVKQAQGRTIKEKRLGAMGSLTKDTPWEQIVSGLRLDDIDRTVHFTNRDSAFRQPLVEGLALVGDAQGYANPILGTGFLHIAADVTRLVDHIAAAEDLDAAARTYNHEMTHVFKRRQRRSQIAFRGIQAFLWALEKKQSLSK